MTWLYRTVLFLTRCFFKVFYRHKVYGLEHFYSKAAIIASNHVSNYDPPILAISWPEEVHFLAREGLFKNAAFGWLIRKLNAHPVSGDAGDVTVFKTICSLLAEGKKVILFPEGTRGRKDALGVLKPGVAMLVSRSKAAVVPAYVHGTFYIWNRQSRLPKLWGKTACVFGTPILWEQFAHLGKKEAQAALTASLADAIRALRLWYEQGAQGVPP
jgi:1-acyl-sn-glycerol-3-phosphate acyltransferase